MRDSINYNLKYFIMKMSGTKPMKNTMRKPSPLKIDNGAFAAARELKSTGKVIIATPKQNEANKAKRDAHKASFRAAHKAKGTTKGATTSGTFTTKKETATPGKTRGMFSGALEKAKAIASKAKAQDNKPVEGKPSSKPTASKGAFAGAASKAAEIASKATPAMQLKKAGMKKKC